MTDLEKFMELFSGLGIGKEDMEFETARDNRGEIIRINMAADSKNVKIVGYSGFFITVDFDSRGKFINIGAWE